MPAIMVPSMYFIARRHILKKRDAFLPRCGVLRCKVHVGCHANTISEGEVCLSSGALERGSLRVTHACNFGSVNFENVKTTLLGSFDKLDGLCVPVLGPV